MKPPSFGCLMRWLAAIGLASVSVYMLLLIVAAVVLLLFIFLELIVMVKVF